MTSDLSFSLSPYSSPPPPLNPLMPILNMLLGDDLKPIPYLLPDLPCAMPVSLLSEPTLKLVNHSLISWGVKC